jgi:hypothetical protein
VKLLCFQKRAVENDFADKWRVLLEENVSAGGAGLTLSGVWVEKKKER